MCGAFWLAGDAGDGPLRVAAVGGIESSTYTMAAEHRETLPAASVVLA